MFLLTAAPYAELRGRAETIDNLGRWLTDYVGDCASAEAPTARDRRVCRSRVARFRKKWRGKLVRVTLDEPVDLLTLEAFDQRKKAFRVNLLPFIAARGIGMSVGRPRRLDAEGRPVVGHLPLWVRLPEDTPAFVFRRNLERGMVRLELVVVPKGAYRMRRAGQAPVRGLEVTLKGLRLVRARSGDVLAEQTFQR